MFVCGKAQYDDYPIDSSFINCDLPFKLNCNNFADENHEIFCEAAQKAYLEKDLSLMTLGDPGHISACTYYAYKYWGVKLIALGDIVFSEMEAQADGHNCVMRERIKEYLGPKYDSLGLLPNTIRSIKEEIIDSLFNAFEIETINKDSFSLIINADFFPFLDHALEFTDYHSKITFDLVALKKKVVLPFGRKGSTHYLNVLKLKIGDFKGSKYWCGHKSWNFPIKIKLD